MRRKRSRIEQQMEAHCNCFLALEESGRVSEINQQCGSKLRIKTFCPAEWKLLRAALSSSPYVQPLRMLCSMISVSISLAGGVSYSGSHTHATMAVRADKPWTSLPRIYEFLRNRDGP
jgi:hypothetical protein